MASLLGAVCTHLDVGESGLRCQSDALPLVLLRRPLSCTLAAGRSLVSHGTVGRAGLGIREETVRTGRKKNAQLCFTIRKWSNFACEHPSKRGGCAFATPACLLLVGGLTATQVWVVSAGLLHSEAAAKALEAHVLEMGVLGALQELHGLSFPRRRLAGSQHLLQFAAVGRVRRAPGHAHLYKRVRA